MNYWDDLMGTDEGAANYMLSYGEGPGSDTRHVLSNFVNVGDSVLDVGCGPGWNMEHFLEYGPGLKSYKGVDYSERFVKVCNERRFERKKAGQLTHKVLPFELQDCRDLQEPDESWDVVLLQDVLEHTNGYEKPVEEALRVARKRVVIVFWKAFRKDGDGDQINDDGNDGYGSNYEQKLFEEFLTKTGYMWNYTETPAGANRHHYYYIVDKETE